MTENKNTIDAWTIAVLLLWLAIFMAGLFPETVFHTLRELGYVVTMRALVNSHWFITLACAGYLGWFTFSRCLEYGEAADVALGKSVQILILGITAFLPLRMEQLHIYFSITIPFYRYLILSVVAVKAVAWLFLLTLLLRYYLVSGHQVFRKMPLMFPSAFFPQENEKKAGPASTEDACDSSRRAAK